jgi:hypothetical protein
LTVRISSENGAVIPQQGVANVEKKRTKLLGRTDTSRTPTKAPSISRRRVIVKNACASNSDDLPVVHSRSRTEMGLEKITVGEAVEWRVFDPGRYERNAGRIIDPD